jgi:hypothetical protein
MLAPLVGAIVTLCWMLRHGANDWALSVAVTNALAVPLILTLTHVVRKHDFRWDIDLAFICAALSGASYWLLSTAFVLHNISTPGEPEQGGVFVMISLLLTSPTVLLGPFSIFAVWRTSLLGPEAAFRDQARKRLRRFGWVISVMSVLLVILVGVIIGNLGDIVPSILDNLLLSLARGLNG